MYHSKYDTLGKLEFPFDAKRKYNNLGNALDWLEYPYKMKQIEKVVAMEKSLTFEQAAGLLLIVRGDLEDAKTAIMLSAKSNEWMSFGKRFSAEKAAFQEAKKVYLLEQKAAVKNRLDALQEKNTNKIIKQKAGNLEHQVVKYQNGSKYDGEVATVNGITNLRQGMGSLWNGSGNQNVLRYTGQWRNDAMHGKGKYYWDNGDSWEGQFNMNQFYGKGMYHSLTDESKNQPRYYHHTEHICWQSDLKNGVHIEIFSLMIQQKSLSTKLDANIHIPDVGVIADYDSKNDKHQIEYYDEIKPSRWLCLAKVPFRLKSLLQISHFSHQ